VKSRKWGLSPGPLADRASLRSHMYGDARQKTEAITKKQARRLARRVILLVPDNR
jgi:hypothetical protein